MTSAGSTRDRSISEADCQVVADFLHALQGGESWYLALLDAIGRWVSAEEIFQGQHYRYLVANEAFDWLRLAERLCNEAEDLLPASEVEQLLFYGQPPVAVDEDEFRRRLGTAKYRAHLNFFYGITVEQSLILAAEEELHKAALCGSLSSSGRADPYERVYGLPQIDLLVRFRAEEGLSGRPAQATDLDELNAFLYWLFKYRLKWLDGARVASDTKKGLAKLQQLRRYARAPKPVVEEQPLVLV